MALHNNCYKKYTVLDMKSKQKWLKNRPCRHGTVCQSERCGFWRVTWILAKSLLPLKRDEFYRPSSSTILSFSWKT